MLMSSQEQGYNHILKYTSLFGGVQGLNILISLVRNKIVALFLGPEGMGLVSLFQTTVNFISQSTNLGVSFSAVRNVSELFDAGDEARITHFIKVVRAWSLLTGLVCYPERSTSTEIVGSYTGLQYFVCLDDHYTYLLFLWTKWYRARNGIDGIGYAFADYSSFL